MKIKIVLIIFLFGSCKSIFLNSESSKRFPQYEIIYYGDYEVSENKFMAISFLKRKFLSKNIFVSSNIKRVSDNFNLPDEELFNWSDTFMVEGENWYIRKDQIYQPYFCDCFNMDSTPMFKIYILKNYRSPVYSNGFSFFDKKKNGNNIHYYLTEDYKFQTTYDTMLPGFPYFVFDPSIGKIYERGTATLYHKAISYVRYNRRMRIIDSSSIDKYRPIW